MFLNDFSNSIFVLYILPSLTMRLVYFFIYSFFCAVFWGSLYGFLFYLSYFLFNGINSVVKIPVELLISTFTFLYFEVLFGWFSNIPCYFIYSASCSIFFILYFTLKGLMLIYSLFENDNISSLLLALLLTLIQVFFGILYIYSMGILISRGFVFTSAESQKLLLC